MMLISRIKYAYKDNKVEGSNYIDYVRFVFGIIFQNDPMTKISNALNSTHDYRWFEIYDLMSDTFEFKLK